MQHVKPEATTTEMASASNENRLVRVAVWELPVRLVHWVIFLAIIVLSVTGYYLHNPFLVVHGRAMFTLATVRFIHEVTAFVFTAAFLIRIYWFFVGNRYARWSAFVPHSRRQLRGIGTMLKYYLFLRWRAPEEIGHNPLAALAYLAIYTLFFVQILTGFGLYAWVVRIPPWSTLFGWLPRVLDIQYERQIHFFLMFIFLAFMVHHVYSSILVSVEAKNGLMGSIFSGEKFVPARLLREEEENDASTSQPTVSDGTNAQPVRASDGVA